MVDASVRPTPWAAIRYALRLGCLSFGGPAGQIALVTRELVEERRWIDAATFARALNLAMLLPGPEALQVVIYVGWRLYGIWGGVIAGLSFIGPSAALLIGLSIFYVRFGALAPVAAALVGLQAVVVAVIVLALYALCRRLLRSLLMRLIAMGAFALVTWGHLPVPVALAMGAATLLWGHRASRSAYTAPPAVIDWRRLLLIFSAGTILWLLPWVLLHLWAPLSIAAKLYATLSGIALGGFGGAYAIVAWVGQLFVHDYRWISIADLTAGLGLSETTPGPLLLVLQFYGFVAGWGAADLGSPLWTALVCAALASFSIFLPSFVLVLALAPAVETVVGRPAIKRALEGVGAAVVGIIATFALGVARAVLFPGAILAPRACVIAVVAGVLLHRQRLSLMSTLAAGLFAGWMLL